MLADPGSVRPNTIRVTPEIGRGLNAAKAVAKIVDGPAALDHAEIEDDRDGQFTYHFLDLETEAIDLSRMRRSVRRTEFDVGRIVFDARKKMRQAQPVAGLCNDESLRPRVPSSGFRRGSIGETESSGHPRTRQMRCSSSSSTMSS